MFNLLKEMRNDYLFLALSFILIIISFLFVFNSCQEQATREISLHKYLPGEEIGEWQRQDASQEYEREDLFLYINGGAEIYHEYGFKRVIVQDYYNENGKSLSLEIFEMSSPESAFGIYTFKTSPHGKKLAVGKLGRLEDYYLNFWKGNFLVTITGFDEDEETIRGLEDLAYAVDAKLNNGGIIPSLVALLPGKNLVEPSVKYFKGNLGLFNSYPFFYENVFSLKQGIRGDYRTGYSIFIIKYESGEECLRIFNKVKEDFRESSRYGNYKVINEMGIQVVDNKEKLISISAFRRYILIVISISSSRRAEEAMNLIRAKIKD